MVYRWCLVPSCRSTSITTPEKVFLMVPQADVEMRTQWIAAVRRNPNNFSKTSNLFVCENHFDLKQDMANYMEWKMMGVKKKMKKHVVPHIFDSQPERKRKRIELFEESASTSTDIHSNPLERTVKNKLLQLDNEDLTPEYIHVGVQVKSKFRSKSTQCETFS